MSNTQQDMFAGTSDPHVDTSAPAETPPVEPTAPTPEQVTAPVNPVSGEPPPGSPPVPTEGAPSEPVAPVTAPVVPAPALTKEDLAAAAQTALAAHEAQQRAAQPQAAPTGPAPLTLQQEQEMFKPVQVTPQMLEAINGFPPEKPEQQVAALQQFANGIVENVLRMSMYYTGQQIDSVNGAVDTRLTPLLQEQQRVAGVAQESRFMAGYPGLKDHKDLCLALRDAAVGRKMNFGTEGEAFKFIAEQANKILAGAGVQTPAGQPPGTPVPAGQPAQPAFSMPQTSLGGAPGSGSTSQGQPKSTAKSIFS